MFRAEPSCLNLMPKARHMYTRISYSYSKAQYIHNYCLKYLLRSFKKYRCEKINQQTNIQNNTPTNISLRSHPKVKSHIRGSACVLWRLFVIIISLYCEYLWSLQFYKRICVLYLSLCHICALDWINDNYVLNSW